MARPLAVLFDLDGTLVDSIDLLLAAFHHTFETHLGTPPSDEEWVAGIGTPLITQMRQWVDDEALVERMMTTYRSFQREHHDALLKEFEGARETLALLSHRGHPMALVTSKMNELAHRALEYGGLARYIGLVVGYDSVHRHKPDPEPVRVALQGLGYAPDEAVFVGDSPHDIVAGNAAGVRTIAALWGPFKEDTLLAAGPTVLAAHLRDLPAIIARLAELPLEG